MHPLDPRARDLFGEHRHCLLVVPKPRRERRITGAAQIEVSLQRAVGADLTVAKRRRAKHVVRTELIERGGGGVHLHRGRGLHHRVRILLEERIAPCERHDDRAPLAAARVLGERGTDIRGQRIGATRSGPRRFGRRGRGTNRSLGGAFGPTDRCRLSARNGVRVSGGAPTRDREIRRDATRILGAGSAHGDLKYKANHGDHRGQARQRADVREGTGLFHLSPMGQHWYRQHKSQTLRKIFFR